MKKLIIPFILILLVSCTSNEDSFKMIPINGDVDSNSEIYEKMRRELYDLPDQFDVNGSYDEKFIIIPLNVQDVDKEKIDFLYQEIEQGNEIERIIVVYTDEGDPILRYIKFSGETIFIVSDSTRDAYGKPAYYQKSYKEFQYETDGYRHIYFAVNDTEYTYDEIRNSWEESDYQTGIDYFPVLIFMRHDMDKYK